MSFVIEQPNILFIHIPKCAGNSVRRWFRYKYTVTPQIPNANTESDNYHSTVQDAETFLGNIDNHVLMTVVRNPWQRIFSWFCHRRRNISSALKIDGYHGNGNLHSDRSRLKEELSTMNLSFEAWLDRYHDVPWDYTWFKPSTPQTHWLGDRQFHYVIKMGKTFRKQIRSMAQELGLLNLTYGLPMKNSNPNRELDYKHVYTQHGKNLIAKLHRTDIERFEYTFDC